MALTWKPLYTTGVEKLDEQHRRIFDLANRLETLIENGACDSPEVDALLAQIGTVIRDHFGLEEVCMSRHRCPMAEKNKQEHGRLLAAFEVFLADFNGKKSLATLESFHRAVEGPLFEHICFVDIHLRSCVKPGQER